MIYSTFTRRKDTKSYVLTSWEPVEWSLGSTWPVRQLSIPLRQKLLPFERCCLCDIYRLLMNRIWQVVCSSGGVCVASYPSSCLIARAVLKVTKHFNRRVFPELEDQSGGNGQCQPGRGYKSFTVCLEKRLINCRTCDITLFFMGIRQWKGCRRHSVEILRNALFLHCCCNSIVGGMVEETARLVYLADTSKWTHHCAITSVPLLSWLLQAFISNWILIQMQFNIKLLHQNTFHIKPTGRQEHAAWRHTSRGQHHDHHHFLCLFTSNILWEDTPLCVKLGWWTGSYTVILRRQRKQENKAYSESAGIM